MMTSDPIADMLTRIRNANTAKHDTVDVPSSKMKLAIADILVKEGYIQKYDIVEDGAFKTIRITLKYNADKSERILSGLKRISKPGLRVYANCEELPKVLGGLGVAIISTNKGVITDKEARKSDDLIKRDFKANKPLEKCVTDMTEIKTSEGKLYISAIFGCFDLSVLGLAMDTNMKATLCEKTLENAYKAYPDIRGSILHYGRGTQYTSRLYRKAIKKIWHSTEYE